MSRLSTEEFDVVVGGAAFALAQAHSYPLRVLVVERHPGPDKINRRDSQLPAITGHLEVWQALDRFRSGLWTQRALHELQR